MKTFAKPGALIAGAAFALAAALPLAAQEAAPLSANTVLATVNGEEIKLGHVILARFSLPDEYQALPFEMLLPGLVDQLIQQTVLGQEVDELSQRSRFQADNDLRSIAATETLEMVLENASDDAAIKSAYNNLYGNAAPSREWNASHILVETEEEAAALIEELAGGADFAALAREHSTGPSGPSGGELGWFEPGMMVEPFETAVKELEVGAVGGPTQTQFGWHVIKLNDSRIKGAPALEDVQGDIIAQLQEAAIDKAITDLVEEAEIVRTDLAEIDPEVLGQTDLLDD